MRLQQTIYCRKSIRKYADTLASEQEKEELLAFFNQIQPLYPNIKVKAEIYPREKVRAWFTPWQFPQAIAIFSEEKEGYLENVGFILQQVDLYLQTKGFGSCWLGIGKLNDKAEVLEAEKDGLKYIIMIAFGVPMCALKRGKDDFKRKALSEISDKIDERLECARLAPSSVNSQPWYFTHEREALHLYCSRQGLVKTVALGQLNRIDVGIALAHLYVENPTSFRFFKAEQAIEKKGYDYIGSFEI